MKVDEINVEMLKLSPNQPQTGVDVFGIPKLCTKPRKLPVTRQYCATRPIPKRRNTCDGPQLAVGTIPDMTFSSNVTSDQPHKSFFFQRNHPHKITHLANIACCLCKRPKFQLSMRGGHRLMSAWWDQGVGLLSSPCLDFP